MIGGYPYFRKPPFVVFQLLFWHTDWICLAAVLLNLFEGRCTWCILEVM